METKEYNYLLKRYDTDEKAREILCNYWLANIKRYLNSKYKTIYNKETERDMLSYVMKRRPQCYVFAPLKHINTYIRKYVASHPEMFDKPLQLNEEIDHEKESGEISYEQIFDGLDKMDLMRTLEKVLGSKKKAVMVYRCYVDKDDPQKVAKDFSVSYDNLRTILSRCMKKLEEYYSSCHKK